MVLPLEGLAGEPGAPAAEPALAVLRYEQVAVALTEGVALYDRAGRLLDVNDAFRALLGLDAASGAAAVLLADLVDEHGRPTAGHDHPVRRAALTGRLVSGLVVGVRAPAGDRRWLRVTALPTRCDDGTPVVVLTGSDVTGERSASQALLAAENRFRLAAEHAPIGIVIVSPEGVLLDVNDALCRLLDYSREELTGRTFAEITHPEDLALDVAHVQRLLAGEAETYRLEKRYVAQDGRVLWAQLSVALARDDDGRPLYFVSMIEDITAERAAASALAHRVLHDSLTGLPNRAFLLDQLEPGAGARRRRPAPASPCCSRPRPVQGVNDSLGHEAGDAAPASRSAAAAARLRARRRHRGPLRRRRVRRAVRGPRRRGPRRAASPSGSSTCSPSRCARRREVYVTVSIGIALAGPRRHRRTTLLRDADAAMYRAKERRPGPLRPVRRPSMIAAATAAAGPRARPARGDGPRRALPGLPAGASAPRRRRRRRPRRCCAGTTRSAGCSPRRRSCRSPRTAT